MRPLRVLWWTCALFLVGASVLWVNSVYSHSLDIQTNIPQLEESEELRMISDGTGHVMLKTVGSDSEFPTLTTTNEEERLAAGKSWLLSKRWSSVTNNDTRVLFVDNPDTAQTNLIGMVIRANATAKMELDLFANVTQTVDGAGLNAQNARLGSSDTTAAVAEHQGAYSGTTSDTLWETIVPGGGTGGIQFGGSSQASTIFVPPGNNFLIRATNTSGSGEDLVLTIKWIER